MVKGFTFLKSYYDIILKLRKKQDRDALLNAIVEFVFEDIEPKDLSEVAEIAFESFRQSLEKSKKNGDNSRKGNEIELKSNSNRNQKETKSLLKIDFEEKAPLNEKENKTKKVDKKEKIKEKDINPLKENITPLPPLDGGMAQKDFFKVYCQFKKAANGSYPAIDFERLTEEFAKSSSLRRTFSWQLILDSYDSILAGNFRDKVDAQAEGREYLANRERYYTALRTEEEKKVEAIVKKLMTYPRYAEIDKRLRMIEVESAKADVKGEKLKAAKLEQERNRLRAERNNILSANGLEEDDIIPKRRCYECNDTGWLEDGTMCACYKGD
jgi:hypothetical protein